MSTLAIGSQAITPPSEVALTARVQQLEALLAQARAGFTGTTTTAAPPAAASSTDFAGALQSATAASAPGAEAGGQYEGLIAAAAQRNGIDPSILHGLIQQESGFDPGSQSSAGAQGLTQLMPGTASSMGVSNPLDPAESIEGGARYLGQLLKQFGGNTTDALAAYNAGPGAVSQYGGVPPYQETQDYVTKVLGYAEAYRQSHPSLSMGETIA